MSARSADNKVTTHTHTGGDVDLFKQLIELQSQVVELSRRNAETEKSVALLRQEVAQIRRHELGRVGLIGLLRTRLNGLSKALQKSGTWPANFLMRLTRLNAS